MATKRFCDRCGNETTYVSPRIQLYSANGSLTLNEDLCDHCVTELLKWNKRMCGCSH